MDRKSLLDEALRTGRRVVELHVRCDDLARLAEWHLKMAGRAAAECRRLNVLARSLNDQMEAAADELKRGGCCG